VTFAFTTGDEMRVGDCGTHRQRLQRQAAGKPPNRHVHGHSPGEHYEEAILRAEEHRNGIFLLAHACGRQHTSRWAAAHEPADDELLRSFHELELERLDNEMLDSEAGRAAVARGRARLAQLEAAEDASDDESDDEGVSVELGLICEPCGDRGGVDCTCDAWSACGCLCGACDCEDGCTGDCEAAFATCTCSGAPCHVVAALAPWHRPPCHVVCSGGAEVDGGSAEAGCDGRDVEDVPARGQGTAAPDEPWPAQQDDDDGDEDYLSGIVPFGVIGVTRQPTDSGDSGVCSPGGSACAQHAVGDESISGSGAPHTLASLLGTLGDMAAACDALRAREMAATEARHAADLRAAAATAEACHTAELCAAASAAEAARHAAKLELRDERHALTLAAAQHAAKLEMCAAQHALAAEAARHATELALRDAEHALAVETARCAAELELRDARHAHTMEATTLRHAVERRAVRTAAVARAGRRAVEAALAQRRTASFSLRSQAGAMVGCAAELLGRRARVRLPSSRAAALAVLCALLGACVATSGVGPPVHSLVRPSPPTDRPAPLHMARGGWLAWMQCGTVELGGSTNGLEQGGSRTAAEQGGRGALHALGGDRCLRWRAMQGGQR
jgi:hypothetical protein